MTVLTALRGVGGFLGLGLGLGGEAVRDSLNLGKRCLFPEPAEPSGSEPSVRLLASEGDTKE